MAHILIGGDIYPGRASVDLLKTGNARVFGGLEPLLRAADLAVANLEGPLIERSTPIEKIGPHHGFEAGTIAGLGAAGFRVFNLGNNHAMDHGSEGLKTTLRICGENSIACVGAGENLQAAGAPLIQTVKALRVGFLSCTEHEFGIATETESGTHPIDVIEFVRTLAARRQDWDFLIVLVHGGNEYFPYPRPKLRRLARFMIEQGAGAVIFQHSHCAGCYEAYRGGHIVYGQGNLLFDTRGARACEMEGVLVSLKVGANGSSEIEFIPFRQSQNHPGPDLMSAADRSAFMDSFGQRSRAIQQPGFVEQEWDRFVRATPYNYLALIHGYGQRVRELDQKFNFLRHRYSKKQMRMLLHLMRCESHHEATMQALASALK